MTKYTLYVTIEALNINSAPYTVIARSLDHAIEATESMLEIEYPEYYNEFEIDDTQYLSGELDFSEVG